MGSHFCGDRYISETKSVTPDFSFLFFFFFFCIFDKWPVSKDVLKLAYSFEPVYGHSDPSGHLLAKEFSVSPAM